MDGNFNSVEDEISQRIDSSFEGFPALEENKSEAIRTPRSWDELVKSFREEIKTLPEDTAKVYSRETRIETNITRNPDGSVHKETVTTEKLPDGSTKTSRIVDTTPAGEESRESATERTLTAPAANTLLRWEESWSDVEKPKAVEKSSDSEKKQENSPNNWTWWFWSRK